MKRTILSILVLVLYYNTFAQTVYTPTGVGIEAYVNFEFADGGAAAEAEAMDWIARYGYYAKKVAPASNLYNCHDFAWNYSDGGSIRWVNQLTSMGGPNVTKYFSGTSPTYQQTNIDKATKAFYPDGDHSLVMIAPNMAESKWGGWPRFQHYPSECPYSSANAQYYYVPMNGDETILCTSKTYSTVNIPGAIYTWSGGRVSISGSGSSVTATKWGDGTGWIQTQIYSPYLGTTINPPIKTFWVGVPVIANVSGQRYNQVGASVGYSATVSDARANVTSYNWSLIPGIFNNYFNPGGDHCNITWYRAGEYALVVNA